MTRKSKQRRQTPSPANASSLKNSVKTECSSELASPESTRPFRSETADDDSNASDQALVDLGVNEAVAASINPVLEAIHHNTALVERLVAEFSAYSSILRPIDDQTHQDNAIAQLNQQLCDFENENIELRRQNEELAAKVASANIRRSTDSSTSDFNDSLSWEERKQLIIKQMEEDSYDAQASIFEAIRARSTDPEDITDPIAFIDEMMSTVEMLKQENAYHESEIRDLNHLLQNRPSCGDVGIAIGAAGIAEMLDSDALIVEERERLQLLQAQWEDKFRQAEIDASLERAKLSRERQEVAKRQAELEDQLDRLRRDANMNSECEGHSRKWLAKLGLAD